MTKEKLTNDILANIAARKKLAKRDYNASEILLTIAILSSFLTAILAVNDNVDKFIIATLGGLSGLLIVIDKRFSYAKRSTWNELYCMDLQRLISELEFAEPLMVEEKYTALEEKKERERATKNLNFNPH